MTISTTMLREYSDKACFVDSEAREIILKCAEEIEQLNRECRAWADAFNKHPSRERELIARWVRNAPIPSHFATALADEIERGAHLDRAHVASGGGDDR